ncbi:MAG: hypothetical protein A2X32_02925 [Elusimicrobia bacterium GWC2_64_44]|nr:MAG: hypothetical protein A2X32_02925 [Elusimicrobia bacterium GWC2_64_44]
MKYILIICALLAQPLAAADGAAELELRGYLSAWTQACAGASCQLPKPGERSRPVALRLALPSAPGEAAAAHASEKLLLPGGGELEVDLDFYAVCPYAGKAAAPAPCAGRYFQAQVSLSGPAGAFCAAALNADDFAPFPVLMCAGPGQAGLRYGVTLHRQPL